MKHCPSRLRNDASLDEKIDISLYERKYKQYTEEKDRVLQSLKRHSETSNKYFELGINIYDLSQKAPEIYHRATIEEKRQLIKLIFDKITLNEGKLTFAYSKPFEILSQAIKFTNSSKVLNLAKSKPRIFELDKLSSNKAKNRALHPVCSVLLRR